MKPMRLHEVLQLPEGAWKVERFCDEPNTGLCVLSAVDPPGRPNLVVPCAWVEALRPDPSRNHCKRCGSDELETYCAACGEEQ